MTEDARRRPLLTTGLSLLLVAAVAAAFAPAFEADFVYDDFRFLLYNPVLDAPLDPAALFLDRHSFSGDSEPDIYRPLATLSFYAEKRIGGGEPFAHHVAGLVLHALNSVLVFLFLRRLLGRLPGREDDGADSPWPALLGAALFALHPVQVESVVWISSRAGQLAALFTLLALLAATGRSRFAIPVAALLTLVACFSKEAGVATGVLILVLWFTLKPFRTRKVFLGAAASLAAAALFMAIRGSVMEGLLSQVPPHGGDRLTGLLYGGYGSLYQIGLLFRPWFHNLDYQNGFFDGTPIAWVAAGAALYLLVVAAGLLLVRRAPGIACGVLLFAAAQVPSSSILVTLRSLVNDRYLYVPLAGAALIAAVLIRRFDGGALPRAIARTGTVALLVVLALLSFDRSREWRTGLTLWQAAIETHPGSTKSYVGLSRALLEAGRPEEALEVAVKGYGGEPFGTSNRMNAIYKAAQALIALERPEQADGLLDSLLTEAESDRRTGEFRHYEKACIALWGLRISARRYDEAAGTIVRLIRRFGESPHYYDMLGMTLLDAGRETEAEEAFERGVRLPGDYAEIHFHLADLYKRTGRSALAAEQRRLGEEKRKEREPASGP